MPYLYREALATVASGVSVMRAMLVEFPTDPTSAYLDRQYMLGEKLLVAPVFAEDGEVTYYLPAERWTHLLTGEVKSGPIWVTEKHNALSIPFFVRPGSVLPIGNNDSRPDYDYADGVTLHVYQFTAGDTQQVTIPTLDGAVAATFEVVRKGDTLTLTKRGDAPDWRIKLIGGSEIGAIEGCTVESTEQGISIIPSAAQHTVTIQLF